MENPLDSVMQNTLDANRGRAILPSTAAVALRRGGAAGPARVPESAQTLALLDGPDWTGPQAAATRAAERWGWGVPDGWAGVVWAAQGTDLGEAIRSLAIGGLLVWLGAVEPATWPDGVDLTPVEGIGGGLAVWRRGGEVMPGSRGCVVCGSQNPVGLALRFMRSGDRVFASGRPPAHFEGFDGVLHGGIVTALMDDALWYAIHAATGMIGMTVDLQVRFKRPARIGDELTVAGRFAGRRRNVAEATARIFGPDGEVLAEAGGRFLPGRQPLRWDGAGG